MKKILFLFAAIIMAGSFFFGQNLMEAMADTTPAPSFTKYYTSIQIEEGQNLWSIAKDYNYNSGMSTAQYIEELKSMNCLSTDTIHAGNYLTVIYFDSTSEQ